MSLKNSSVVIKIPRSLKKKLKNKRIYKIYKKFEKSLNINQDFVVAVSGGPDSLALAFLTKIYANANFEPNEGRGYPNQDRLTDAVLGGEYTLMAPWQQGIQASTHVPVSYTHLTLPTTPYV